MNVSGNGRRDGQIAGTWLQRFYVLWDRKERSGALDVEKAQTHPHSVDKNVKLLFLG